MKKIKIQVKLGYSDKKFYEDKYQDSYECKLASQQDAINRIRKLYPTIIISDVFADWRYESLCWGPRDEYYVSKVRGYIYLPSKKCYKKLIKTNKIRRV